MEEKKLCYLDVDEDNSIVLFGAESQTKLRQVSGLLAKIVSSTNSDVEQSLLDIVNDIDDYHSLGQKKYLVPFFNTQKRRYEHTVNVYSAILIKISNIATSLKIQEAELLKDNSQLARLKEILNECVSSLENDINEGESYLREHTISVKRQSWAERLERKIEDLSVSKIVAMQSISQIDLIIQNNNLLIDRIVAALNTTIPAWTNQISLLLGIANIDNKTIAQDSLNNYLLNLGQKIQGASINYFKEVDVTELFSTNEKLGETLKDLALLENKQVLLSKELVNVDM